MGTLSKLIVITGLLAGRGAHAELLPPSEVAPTPPPPTVNHGLHRDNPNATTDRWGGGIRLTGLSGIGALPGVNFGGEVALHLRRVEHFVELALGRWTPEETIYVSSSTDPTRLRLDTWTLRGGWASMRMPLRAWVLVEVGEVAAAPGMNATPGVLPRMMMGDTPDNRRWQALGAGIGVAWPLSRQARFIGNMEVAIPVNREELMIDNGTYKPDPLAARYSVGLEVGWR